MIKENLILRSLLLLIVISVTLSSCTKEIENWIDQEKTIYDTVSNRTDNRIIEFKVNNFNEFDILGAIDEEKKTVTVYLPYYSLIEFIEPILTLPEGASISPSMDELVPVFPSSPFEYTVTGKSGNSAIYRVNAVVQQPTLTATEFSSSTSKTVFTPTGFVNKIIILDVKGTNLVPDPTATNLFLVNNDGEIVLRFNHAQGNISSGAMSFVIEADKFGLLSKDTDYWLELKSYALTYKFKYPIKFNI